METLNFTAVIITQNLKTSENQDTKLCVNALEQDPNFVTGHETTSLPITSNSHKQPYQYPPGIYGSK